MSQARKSSPLPDTHPPAFSPEDWLLIDEALNRVAQALRKLEKVQQQQASDNGEYHSPKRR